MFSYKSDKREFLGWLCSGNDWASVCPWEGVIDCLFALILAVMDLIISIVASMELHFGFVLETVFTTQGYFCFCWVVLTQVKVFSDPRTMQWVLGVHEKLGEAMGGADVPKRTTPYIWIMFLHSSMSQRFRVFFMFTSKS